MTEQVLTDGEKNALLDGVTSGAVEVHSSGGPQYASVREFDVSARSRMVTNSYPRLQSINQEFSDRLARTAEYLLQCELEVSFTGLDVRTWSNCCFGMTDPSMAFLFAAAPLPGNGLVILHSELVGHLVESFFGSEVGSGYSNGGASFSPGEKSVANRFCDAILSTVQDAWRPIIELSPERVASEVKIDLIDIARDSDPIIASSFELSLAGHRGAFHILWPREMVTSLLPAFDGRKQERNAAVDAAWEKAIRRRLADAPIRITTCIGDAQHTLGDVTALSPGDVLPIECPRAATVLAERVPIIKGRFGVLEGRNAVEATEWLPRDESAARNYKEI